MIIKISKNIIIRKEPFGGSIFDKYTGTIIEVDGDAFDLIFFIQNVEFFDTDDLSQIGSITDIAESKKLIDELINLNIFIKFPGGILNKRYYDKFCFAKESYGASFKSAGSLPQTVHMAIAYRCENNCPDCYMRRHEKNYNRELSLENIYKVIENIALSGVFQLAVGGGEPFLREDLYHIVKKAYEKGLTVHVTTGMYKISRQTINDISKYIAVLQIGIQTDAENGKIIIKNKTDLSDLLKILNESSIKFGANLVINKTVAVNLNEIINILECLGFHNITLIRYKPPKNILRWESELLTDIETNSLEKNLVDIISTKINIKFRFDCGFAFLQRKLSPDLAFYMGYKGCCAGNSILSVSPDGSVFPCSQLVGPLFYSGNLLNESLLKIYNESKVLIEYRNFRNSKSFIESNCGICSFHDNCGDCRVFAQDAMNKDIGCYNNFNIYPEWIKK